MNPAVAPDVEAGWHAGLRLGFRADGRRTVLAHRERSGPLAVQRSFYPEGPVCHVYLLHPPGGVVGGDRLNINVSTAANAQALVTTPGATKFYRTAEQTAYQVQRLDVAAGGSLEWLPQENIVFPGAKVQLETRVDLHGDARLALWEIHCLGRPAINEAFDGGGFDSSLTICRDRQPVLVERLRLSAENRLRRAQMAGHPVTGTLVLSHAGPAQLDAARALLTPDPGGLAAATLLDDVLLVRYLGPSTEHARRLFDAVWRCLRPQTIGLEPSPPRIWAT